MTKGVLDFLLATDGLPGWVCVGHSDPQAQLHVFLETSSGTFDVSRNHAIVGLKPLTVALSMENSHLPSLQCTHPQFVIREPDGGVLGRIKLQLSQSLPVHSAHLCLFRTLSGHNHCAPALRREGTYLYERWKLSRDKNSDTPHMTASDLFNMWILHDLPRPVHLVSYGGMALGNMFPMDLLGLLASGTFVVGIHANSPAIPLWQRQRQIAVSAVPLRYKPTVYGMGRNHRRLFLDPSALPIPSSPSETFQIPVPDEALSVRELSIEQSLNLGSHVLFVARTTKTEKRAEEPQMCHVHRFYQQFLMRHNRPLPLI
ncbi:MAG: hypothetical protein ABI822_24435 [Bryobacteraceae bacterium]